MKKMKDPRGRILFFVVMGLAIVAFMPYEAIFSFVFDLVSFDFSLTIWKPVMGLVLWLLLSLPIIYIGKGRKDSVRGTAMISLLSIGVLGLVALLTPSDWFLVVWSLVLRTLFWLAVFTLVIIKVLAPNNLFFTKVKEYTSRIIVKGGQFDKCLIQLRGYTFNREKEHPDEWTVVPETDGKKEPRHPLGGIRFYGVWPLWDVKKYDLQWTTVKEEEETPKGERLAYVPLYDDIYLAKVLRAEDIEKLHLDIHLYIRIQIINPYRAVFAPQAWLEMIMNTTRPLVRRFVANTRYDDLLQEAAAEEVLKELEQQGFLGEEGDFIKRYGVKILSIHFRQIDPPEQYRKETLAELVAELEAAATVARAGGDKLATVLKAEGFTEKMALISGEFSRLPPEISKVLAALLISELTSGKDVPGMYLHHIFSPEGLAGKAISGEDLDKIVQALQGVLNAFERS